MDLPPTSLHTAFSFTSDDLDANRRGAFSDEQRGVVVLLGKVIRAQRRVFISALPTRSATQPLPQIRVVTGHVHTLSETRFVRAAGSTSGLLVESFFLIVHGAEQDVELPIAPDAVSAFERNRDYTVYYFINKDTPTLLSVTAES